MSAQAGDRTISNQVTQRLATRGIRTPCRVGVETKNGEVTLTGNIQYPYQRSAAMNAAATTPGVRHVVDRLTIKPAVKRPQPKPATSRSGPLPPVAPPEHGGRSAPG
jgi:hypothetical protein